MKISAQTLRRNVDGEPSTDHRARLISLLLALITVLVYLPAGFHDFMFLDDPDYVSQNAIVQNGLTWAGLKWAFVGWHASNWHPLTWLSLQLDCQLFGLNPGAEHLVNVLFHAANAVLLFHLWLRLTKACWPSAFVAALFAWHPLHVESVAWIAERKDVLSTFFGLLALLSYARYAAGRPAGATGWVRQRHWWLAMLFLALGLLAKSMLVTLPFVLLLLDYWPLRRFTADDRFGRAAWQLIREKWPFFLLTAAFCTATFLAQSEMSIVSLQQVPPGLRLENAVVAWAAYLGKTVWPVNLCVFYPLPRHYPPAEWLLAGMLLTVVSVLAWHWREQRRSLLTGWLWFFGMLVPVIGLNQSGAQAMADRYTYLPVTGLFVAATFEMAAARERLKIPARWLGIAAFFVLAGCVAFTERQLSYWRDSETLFQHAVAVTKNNCAAHMFLGLVYKNQGRMDEAQRQFQEAMAASASVLMPVAGAGSHPTAEQELVLGEVAEQRGALADAIAHYRAALASDPGVVEAHNNLGNLLDLTGQTGAALREYQAAARLRPENPLVHENLGTQLAELGRFDEAMREYQTAAQLAPANPRPNYLIGKLWLRRGQSAAAVTAFEQVLQLDPDDSQTLVYLARVLASDAASQIRNGTRAVTLAEHANVLTGGTQPFVLGTLAMAYAETGRFGDARQTVRHALDLATGASAKTVSDLQAQLKRYEANQPFRASFPGTTY